ncbi:MAG: hypothetical protein KF678_10980 [Phycisphaeraceae bacterium]|nr:hypothetical protein [Phycisphaeraceae bacterium]
MRTPARNTTRPWYRGAALQITMLCIAAGTVAWAGVVSVWPGNVAAVRMAKYQQTPAPIEVEAALGQLGLTPKVMAAANLSAEQTGAFAAAAAAYVREHIAAYRIARDAVYTAHNQANLLRRQIRGSNTTAQTLTDYAASLAAVETARSQQHGVLNSALAAAAEEISPAALTLLNTIRANKLKWTAMPERFLGDSRSPAEWVALRDAVANERISGELDVDPDPACQQLLTVARGTLNSIAAQSNMANLAEIQAAWTAAMGQ